jgi:hypothetical protein
MHAEAMQDVRLSLHQAGVSGPAGEQEALDAIRQQMDIEAIATGFRESFLLICVCFLIAVVPMLCLLSRRLRATTPLA